MSAAEFLVQLVVGTVAILATIAVCYAIAKRS